MRVSGERSVAAVLETAPRTDLPVTMVRQSSAGEGVAVDLSPVRCVPREALPNLAWLVGQCCGDRHSASDHHKPREVRQTARGALATGLAIGPGNGSSTSYAEAPIMTGFGVDARGRRRSGPRASVRRRPSPAPSRCRPRLRDPPRWTQGARPNDTKSAGKPRREALGRSRIGLTTKIHLAADTRCRPISRVTTAGHRHGCAQLF